MKACLLMVSLLACGCGDDPSDLVIRISSDLKIPGQIDEIKLTAKYATKLDRIVDQSWSVDPSDNNKVDLPARVRLVPGTDGVARTVELELRGLLAGSPVVDQQATLPMPSGGVLVLEMSLTDNCTRKTCNNGRTCIAGECSAIERSLGALSGDNDPGASEIQSFQLP